MGYAIVVFESVLSSRFFKRQPETSMLNRLYGVGVITIWLYLGIRFVELIARGRLGLMFRPDGYALMFWIENLVLVGAAVLYYRGGKTLTLGTMFRGAMLMTLAGVLYRFDTYLVAFNPGENWVYFPTVPEILVTVGIIAIEIAIYVAIVRRFPILAGKPGPAAAAAPA